MKSGLGTFLLTDLPKSYKPVVMTAEYSGTTVSVDFVRTKLLAKKSKYPR